MFYRLYQDTRDEGRWTSPEFHATSLSEVCRAVVAGLIVGEARWAKDEKGAFLYGLDADGEVITAEPKVACDACGMVNKCSRNCSYRAEANED